MVFGVEFPDNVKIKFPLESFMKKQHGFPMFTVPLTDCTLGNQYVEALILNIGVPVVGYPCEMVSNNRSPPLAPVEL
jgi:hypothetical protein